MREVARSAFRGYAPEPYGFTAREPSNPLATRQPAETYPAGPDASEGAGDGARETSAAGASRTGSADPRVGGSSSSAPPGGAAPGRPNPHEAPVWGKYIRTAQWVLALVALSLVAASRGWAGLPPFRFLLAMAVMTLVFVLTLGALEWVSRARRLLLPLNTAFDCLWTLLCATAGVSAAAGLGLRLPLRMGCVGSSDCAQLKAATGMMFGLALLAGLSLAYEVLLWRAGWGGLPPDSRLRSAAEYLQIRKKASVRILQPSFATSAPPAGPGGSSPAEGGPRGSGGGRDAGPGGGLPVSTGAETATGGGSAAAASGVSSVGSSGGGGVLGQAGRMSATCIVKEASWLARLFLLLRSLQVLLAAAALGAMASVPRYRATTAYALLVGSQAAGLALAAGLGAWQALRAIRPGFYPLARRGTRAYLALSAVVDAVLWPLVAAAAVAAAAVSTLPCVRVVVGGGVAMLIRVHAGCSSYDRAAAALALLSAPVWLASAGLSLAAAHEGTATAGLLRRHRTQAQEAHLLMTRTSGSSVARNGSAAPAPTAAAATTGTAGSSVSSDDSGGPAGMSRYNPFAFAPNPFGGRGGGGASGAAAAATTGGQEQPPQPPQPPPEGGGDNPFLQAKDGTYRQYDERDDSLVADDALPAGAAAARARLGAGVGGGGRPVGHMGHGAGPRPWAGAASAPELRSGGAGAGSGGGYVGTGDEDEGLEVPQVRGELPVRSKAVFTIE
ncbi:hypothetical protein GPECTOR_5g216 [Gonium pectorale]|uniref:Uncharacterized protein n=1 Tax=Gonium pectorale TaxID=33097 RepID=A0A150GWD4_GONPE|nr:hypothetical protein GPECTOR_5g216 [Gonium pectorale]|eukprot:KXZ54114.1 hypothetical protein GPECTOR_5g216 [Gonium pectorale]